MLANLLEFGGFYAIVVSMVWSIFVGLGME